MPQATLEKSYVPRPWVCEHCERVIGVVMRDVKRIPRLWVFRVPRLRCQMPTDEIVFERPKGMFIIHGLDWCDEGIECGFCGAVKEWNMGANLRDRLLQRKLV